MAAAAAATTAAASSNKDALSLFRESIVSQTTPPVPTTSADPSSATDYNAALEVATHILFNSQSATEGATRDAFPCNEPTRFISSASNTPLDLLSVYWCWQNREKSVGEYITLTQTLNNARQASGLSSVTNLVFAEKLDLNNWLAGEIAETESEFIKSLGDTAETRRLAADAANLAKGGVAGGQGAGGEDGDVVMGDGGAVGGGERGAGLLVTAEAKDRETERLNAIYKQERKMGDRNSVLRGIKHTDFSHVRKYTALFLSRSAANKQPQALTPALRTPLQKASSRKPEPIILLSPSASSLLRLSNIKSFLDDGIYTPPTSGTATNMAQISRLLPSIDPSRPTRFILVESPENFKPDYWNRVVAVFTTGQSWQFKGYKWSHPAELFARVLGVYVGWRNEGMPDVVKGWGRGVKSVGVEYWREGQAPGEPGASARWRDREVVEEIWSAIEASMRAKGFGK